MSKIELGKVDKSGDKLLSTFEPIQSTLSECRGDFNKMVKRFAKRVKKNGVFEQIRENSYYKSKGKIRREAKLRAIRLQKKQESE